MILRKRCGKLGVVGARIATDPAYQVEELKAREEQKAQMEKSFASIEVRGGRAR